jgi:hypothetical protein
VAYIYHDDLLGRVELLPLYYLSTLLASRFHNWSPTVADVADRATQMSTGRVVASFTYRTDYLVTFELRNLTENGPTGASGLTPLANAQRLMRWAANGGAFFVSVEDSIGTGAREAYAAAPMVLTLADPKLMLYTLSVTALAASGGPWVANYDGARQ